MLLFSPTQFQYSLCDLTVAGPDVALKEVFSTVAVDLSCEVFWETMRSILAHRIAFVHNSSNIERFPKLHRAVSIEGETLLCFDSYVGKMVSPGFREMDAVRCSSTDSNI